MANFGIGLGAFADGFARGYGIRRQMNRDKREDAKFEREDALRKQFADARTDYDSAIADNVLTQAGQADPNQVFDAEGAARQATKKIGTFEDFVYQQQLPKIIDTAVAQGDLETADRLRKWGEDKKERKRTQLFGAALNDFYAGQSTGDYTAFADKAMELLNTGGYPGNMKATGYEFKQGEDGTQGITFHLEQDGKKHAFTFDSMQSVGEFLAGHADPRVASQRFAGQVEAGSKFKAKIAEEEAKAQIGLAREVALEDVKHQNRLQLEASKSRQTGSKIQQDYEFMSGLMRENGFTEEEIKAYIPAMLKIGEYRKGRSPEEFAQQIVLELSKDPLMARKPPEEIEAKARYLVQLAMRVAQQSQGATPAPAAQPGLGTSR